MIKINLRKIDEKEIYPCFTPSLVAVLLNRENSLGRALTEREVYEIRDNCNVVMLPVSMKAEMDNSRGYEDIDPENCWLEWQQFRTESNED